MTLLTTAHDVADGRIHRHVRALSRQGVTVDVIGTGVPGGAPSDARNVRVTGRPRGPLRRLLVAILAPARTRGALLIIDPELIPSAWLWTRVRRTQLIVDLHEDYLDVSRDRPWSRGPVGAIARMLLRGVYAAARRADLTVVADDHLPPATARRRFVVRNVPARGELPDAGSRDDAPRAIYIGDLRPSRGLWTMLDVVAQSPTWRLDLVGELREIPRARVDERIRRLGLTDRVRLLGRQPPDRAWQQAVGAWCGLAMLHDTPAYRRAVPTKVYEYLLAGLPVLATPLPRVEELLRTSGGGSTPATASEAAAMLRHWSTHPDVLDGYRQAIRLWATQQFAVVSPFDDFAGAAHALLSRSRRSDDGTHPPKR